MSRFKTLIAPLIIILTIVFIIGLIGTPKPSYEKAINKKPGILPSETEELEYNKDGKWEVKLDSKLAQVENLVIEAIDTKSLKSYSSLKNIKSPVKIKRNGDVISIKSKEKVVGESDEVIIAVAKPMKGKRVSWKKSYLVNLKPKTVFVNSEEEDNQRSGSVEELKSHTVTSSRQEDGRVGVIAQSEKFIFGKPKPSPSPEDTPKGCSFAISDNVTEGDSSSAISVSYTEGSKVLSASISNVKAINKRSINVGGTSMSFTKKFDRESNSVHFVTQDAKWYGVKKGRKKDNVCYFHEEQSAYKARVRVKIRTSDGETCELDEEHEFIVRGEHLFADGNIVITNQYHNFPTKTVQDTSRRCCVEIQPQPSPILVKRPQILNFAVGQYRNIAQKEEERHVKQGLGGLPWSKGGNLDEPNNRRVYSKLSKIKYCATKRLFGKGGTSNLCTRAINYARRGLKKAGDEALGEYNKWMAGKDQTCWREYTAKRDIKLDHYADYLCTYGAGHDYPEHALSPDCPPNMKPPAYLPPVRGAVFSLDSEDKQ